MNEDIRNNYLQYLNTSFCFHPWEYMDVYYEYVKVCCWSKERRQPLIFDSDGDLDVIATWNGDVIRAIRKEILQNDWEKTCRLDFCPKIQNKTLKSKSEVELTKYEEYMDGPKHIANSAQTACNLWCPQCRQQKVSNKCESTESGIEYKIFNGIKKYILTTSKGVSISMLGLGEPFYVTSVRKFLFETDLRNKPNIYLGFNTNGLLLTPRTWDLMEKTRNNIAYASVSVDACTKETYNKIRLGGSWEQLVKNMEFWSKLRSEKKIKDISLSMVVQKDNYKEIVGFYKMAESYGFHTYYTTLQATDFTKGQWFIDNIVHTPSHPLYQDFLNVMKDPYLEGKNLSSIKIFRDIAMKQENK